MSQDAQANLIQNALKYSIETSINSTQLEEENKLLRDQLKKNEELLSEFDEALPRAKYLQKELKDKQEKIEQKRKELVDIQEAIISTLNNQSQTKESAPQASLAPIPMVMNRVQDLLMTLTESAVDSASTSIPILSLFKVSDQLNQLYDVLSEKGIIEETPEERDNRMTQFVVAQKQILEHLKAMLAAADAEVPEEEEEEEEEIPPQPHVTTVEVVDENEETPAKEEENTEAQAAEDAPATNPETTPTEEVKPEEKAE